MKIALIENFGSDFYGARLRYAQFLKDKGHEVVAIIPNDGYVEKISQKGIRTIAVDLDIRKRSLVSMFQYAQKLRTIFRKENFDVIHLYRMQPNLIGTFTAFTSSRDSKIINHITGLGVAFTKNTFKYKFLQFIIKSIYNINNTIFGATLVFQNDNDKIELGNNKKFAVVRGSAVNEDRFNPQVKPNEKLYAELGEKISLFGNINLVFVSRLLKQKGLSYLTEAIKAYNSRILSEEQARFNLIVAGWIDPNNPDSFTEEEIFDMSKEKNIVFLGRRNDIEELIAVADIAVLPTFYREGTPRFLLEAMVMAKPVLTTDMPGCSHLVENGQNGTLVEPKSKDALVKAFEFLMHEDLKQMGARSKELYHQKFSEDVVYNQLLQIYHSK